jgi:hypothetical protein
LSWNPLVVKDESGLMGWEIVRDIFEGEGDEFLSRREQ